MQLKEKRGSKCYAIFRQQFDGSVCSGLAGSISLDFANYSRIEDFVKGIKSI